MAIQQLFNVLSAQNGLLRHKLGVPKGGKAASRLLRHQMSCNNKNVRALSSVVKIIAFSVREVMHYTQGFPGFSQSSNVL